MKVTVLHPHSIEGAARRVSTCQAPTPPHCQSAIGHLDDALENLRAMKRKHGSRHVMISLGPLIARYLEDCERVRSKLETLGPGAIEPVPEMTALFNQLNQFYRLMVTLDHQKVIVAAGGSAIARDGLDRDQGPEGNG